MLKTMLGRMVPGLLRATKSETKVVIAGGYNKGAGSKLVGIRSGIHLEVDVGLALYDQATTLRGYRTNSAEYNRPSNWKSVQN